MNEQRRKILDMLAEGKITADEAERLIGAVEREWPESPQTAEPRPKPRPKYLRVVVNAADGPGADGASRVDVQIPLQLLRAGVRLASLVRRRRSPGSTRGSAGRGCRSTSPSSSRSTSRSSSSSSTTSPSTSTTPTGRCGCSASDARPGTGRLTRAVRVSRPVPGSGPSHMTEECLPLRDRCARLMPTGHGERMSGEERGNGAGQGTRLAP